MQGARVFHALEASISLHSILIGLGFGLGELGGVELLVLALALCVHQFLEGLTLGMLGRKFGLGRRAWQCTYLVFTFSLPLGVVAGVAMRHLYAGVDDSLGFRWCSGLLNGVAAGTLTHVGAHMLNAHGEEASPPRPREPHAMPPPPELMEAAHKGLLAAPKPLPQGSRSDCSSRDQALLIMLGETVPQGLPVCLPEPLCKQPVLRMLAAGCGAGLMSVLAIWA